MCTFSLLPTHDGLLVTSNRDEQLSRPDSKPPQQVQLGDKQVLYSADGLAKGTWFAVDTLGRFSVLLNGAFERHIPKEQYRKSRGLVMLDLLAEKHFVKGFEDMALDQIEPFQIIHGNLNEAFQLVWDGEQKHLNSISTKEPSLFCSATLYSHSQQSAIKNQYHSQLSSLPQTDVDMMELHYTPQTQGGLRLQRDNVCTTSISQAALSKEHIRYRFRNLLSGSISDKLLSIQK